jgi:hypothetical protein
VSRVSRIFKGVVFLTFPCYQCKGRGTRRDEECSGVRGGLRSPSLIKEKWLLIYKREAELRNVNAGTECGLSSGTSGTIHVK